MELPLAPPREASRNMKCSSYSCWNPYRSAGEQRVVVQHQHVNVTADQAAVQVNGGGYPAPRGRGAASKPEERSHGPGESQAVAFEPDPTMRCPEPARDVVPVAGG